MSELDPRKDEVVKGWAKHYPTAEVNSGLEYLTVLALSYDTSAILAKLYREDGEGYKKALQRHLMFYNPEATWGFVILDMIRILEEERAIMLQEGAGSEELEASVDVISNLKAGLTGLLVGIGDTINHGMLRPLLLSMFVPLATEGSWLAGVGLLLTRGVTMTFLAYILVMKGYTLGRKSVVPIPKFGKLNQFIKTVSALSLFMMRTSPPIYAEFATPVSWANAVGEKQLLQDVLNKIFLNILLLLVVFSIYFYIRESGPKCVYILVSILVLPVVLPLFGIV